MASSNFHLALYMASLFVSAIPVTSVGALIPFLAQDLGIDETEYSTIFLMISGSVFIAAILLKILGVYKLLPKYHTVIIISSVEMVIFSVVMVYMKTLASQCIVLSILKFFLYIYAVTANICLMMVPSKEEIGLWMSYSHGAFGMGALAGPIIVGFMGQNMFYVFAGASLIITPFFFFLPSPQDIQKTPQELAEKDKSKPCSTKLGILFYICVFILVGIETTVEGWVPTYAVQMRISAKEQAVQFTSIFWTLQTVFRFLLSHIQSSDSSKLSVSTWGQFFVGIICTILAIFHLPAASAYASSILYGLTLSMTMPLIMAIPYEFGLHYTQDQISNMMISSTISAGVYSTITGELMKITPDMYHYSMMGYSAITLVFFLWIMSTLREEGSHQDNQEKGFQKLPPLEEIA